jgi:D-3-phosphoglycerate dehydrogenase
MKLIVCDPVDPEAIAAMREGGIDVEVHDDITIEGLKEIIADYEAMVVRSRTKVREPLIDKADNLKGIIRAGVGLDSIDVKYAESKGIEVRNTPTASSNAVAELTLGYLFALARPIVQATMSMKEGKWEKKKMKGTELAGKTLGVIGCGRIGGLVAEKADALGMGVLTYDPYVEDFPTCVSPIEFDELISRSDYITLHVPHVEATHYLLNEETFSKMKDGVKIINCGRGGTLDEQALYEAIKSGKVAGAALDVYEDEAEERGQKLMALPQVIGSPHMGAGTVEAKARVGEETAAVALEIMAKVESE